MSESCTNCMRRITALEHMLKISIDNLKSINELAKSEHWVDDDDIEGQDDFIESALELLNQGRESVEGV